MTYSGKLLGPLVSSAIALMVVTNYCIVLMLGNPSESTAEILQAVWPIALPASVAVVLVMSTLYHALQNVLQELDSQQAEALIQAQRDELTGLANRTVFEKKLQAAIEMYRTGGPKFAVVMLDLDHFKRANDLHGHHVGDQVLVAAARRLQAQLRESDTLARFGGDEFLIMQVGVRDDSDVTRLCSRICQEFQKPHTVGTLELRLPVSVGAVVADSRLDQAADLIRAADLALYDAKAEGRNRYRFYSDELGARLWRRQALENDLRDALKNKQGLRVDFQPQVSSSGAVVAAEALFRWTHYSLGEIAASEAVGIAEESELIDQLSEFVFRKAARFAAQHPDLSIAVNLSPAQFSRSQDLADELARLTFEECVNPSQFELEITEQLFMRVGIGCESQVAQLRERGFRIALDDFGTGYSSLSYLRRFKVDRLKLDRSFGATGKLAEDVAVMRAAVSLAHLLGVEVVAEGIESELQESVALEAGCDALQGHRYAPALRPADFASFLNERRKAAA